MFQGVGKRNVIRTGDGVMPLKSKDVQPLEYFYGKTWTTTRPDAEYPRLIINGTGYSLNDVNQYDWQRFSDARLVDVSYLRVKSLTLAYNIPATLCRKIKMQNVRIYLSGQDLFTFSKGTWDNNFDPEEGSGGSGSIYEEYSYPFCRVFSFGIDVKF
jgi:hypothetical protein